MTVKDVDKGTGWSNWSGNERTSGATRYEPLNEDTLRQHIRSARRPIRVVGAGHSFTPIVATDGTIVNLDQMSGLIRVDGNARTARSVEAPYLPSGVTWWPAALSSRCSFSMDLPRMFRRMARPAVSGGPSWTS